jgi:CRISPR-associated endonuclease Cas1
MVAKPTLTQFTHDRNFNSGIVPRHGVVTLFGYGIRVQVERGHLILEDGIGSDRRHARFARVNHGLRRLVVIGPDGTISLAALLWLARQDAAFAMLDRDGSVLVTTGPVRSSDARLRRAQALADYSGNGVLITRELVGQKLLGQERVAREKLLAPEIANVISDARASVPILNTKPAFLALESRAANAYWSAWRNLPVQFPKADLPRVPDHWRTFGPRISPLTRSPRLAVNPANAVLNFLYACLESETRLAVAALGLDPGLGFLHVDTANRDSLACDLMEPVRPMVDAYLLDWLRRGPLRREWFFEQRDGSCRLMGPFAAQLSETAIAWRNAVAPYAEQVSRVLWAGRPKTSRTGLPPTRLTQSHRRQAKGVLSDKPIKQFQSVSHRCRTCGVDISSDSTYCRACGVDVSRTNLIEAAKAGRKATVSLKAQAQRAATQRRQAAARKAWNPSDQPNWLDEKTYYEKVQVRLKMVTVPTIMSALAVSEPYATSIRTGRCIPHPRHWLTLALLVGVGRGADLQSAQNPTFKNRKHNLARHHYADFFPF